MAEWLEYMVSVRDVLGSSPSQGGHKNFCGCREPSDCVSFCRAVIREQFHTHDTKPRKTQDSFQTPYTLELELGPFPSDVARSFLPE